MTLADLQNGDLLFMKDSSALSKAILESTSDFSHVGIYFDTMLYHATPKKGVAKQKLNAFLLEEKYTVFVYRYPHIDEIAVKKAADTYLGAQYNHSFYPDTASFYCSEYIATILPIFETIPMQFGDKKNEISVYWNKYFKALGVPAPLGKPGTNPGQLADSKKLIPCGALEWEALP